MSTGFTEADAGQLISEWFVKKEAGIRIGTDLLLSTGAQALDADRHSTPVR